MKLTVRGHREDEADGTHMGADDGSDIENDVGCQILLDGLP